MKTKTKKQTCPGWNLWHFAVYTITGALIVTMALRPFPVRAQGDLLITPSRVVFEGATSSEVLNLANTGVDTVRYLISFIQYKMTTDGSFEEITVPETGQYFADDHIRYFPRNVVLAPKESQVVKIQLIKTKQLNPGEYRSHLYFRSVPEQKPLGEDEIITDTSTISVRLTPVFGITIPVIIRVGESTAKTAISDLSLSKANNKAILTVTLNRSGNMSVYGNISVDYISPEGKISQVGLIKGVAVYTPNTIRKISLTLNLPGDNTLDEKGKLRVVYTSASDLKMITLAELDVVLGQIL